MDETDSKKDGFFTDSDGNRYLYEKKTDHSDLGFATPQLLEYFVNNHFSLFGAAIPGLTHQSKTTSIEVVYERDRRLLEADPNLSQEFEDEKESLQRSDYSKTRWFMPLMVGVRFKLSDWALRLAYNTRQIDSVKDYEDNFKRPVFSFHRVY